MRKEIRDRNKEKDRKQRFNKDRSLPKKKQDEYQKIL